MGIKRILHKIKIWVARSKGTPIPDASYMKNYGDVGEENFIDELKVIFPQIKKNIIIITSNETAEIDCLVLYQNKLFAIEVKRWKGYLREINDDTFVKVKRNRWTTHSDVLKSPFKQLLRAICILKNENPVKAWINPVVYFADEEFEGISTSSKIPWFSNLDDLENYIKSEGKITYGNQIAQRFFDKCISSDCLFAGSWNSLHCIIDPKSLNIQTAQGIVTRKDISDIHIVHHCFCDELKIRMKDNTHRNAIVENGRITVNDGGGIANYSLCKLDYIKMGR